MTAIAPDRLDSESMATALEQDENYRVLRKLTPRVAATFPPTTEPFKLGLYVDIEATSADPLTARITELAMVPFLFTGDGVIHVVDQGFAWLNDPGIPIPPEVVAITGITDEMVAGQGIEWACVADLADEASLLIAHHASYDRKVFERALKAQFADADDTKPWACSYKDVDWKGLFDARCAKLGHLLMDVCRTFHDGHRALDDAHAGVHLLAAATIADRTAFSYLLESTRTLTARISADNAPYAVKDTLKARKYEWNADAKVWYRDVKPSEEQAELTWLAENACCHHPSVKRFGARDRYSLRVN